MSTILNRDAARRALERGANDAPRRSRVPSELEILARQLSSLREQCDAALGMVMHMLKAQLPTEEEEEPTAPATFGMNRSTNPPTE